MSALVSKIDVVAFVVDEAVLEEPVRKAVLSLIRKTPATTINKMGDEAVADLGEALQTTKVGASVVGQVFIDTVASQRKAQAEKDAATIKGIEEATLSESERPKVETIKPARKRSPRAKRGGGAVAKAIAAEEAAGQNALEALV